MKIIKNLYSTKGGLLQTLVIFSTLLVIATLLSATLFFRNVLKNILEDQIGSRALYISESISLMPQIIDLVERNDPNHELQNIITPIQRNIDAKFIVIGDKNGKRFTHPNIELLGENMVGEDNEKALLYGQYYISKATGTLGPSIRGKSPIFNKKGEIIGVVSVGYLEEKVRKIVAEYHQQLLKYLYIALFVGLLVAVLLSSKLKRSLLGYEPQELSRLFLEKKAILNSVKEAILATDGHGKLTLSNDVANQYFDLDTQSVTPPLELQKYLLIGKEMRDATIAVDNVDYICNLSTIVHDEQTIGMVLSCRKKDEIDAIVWELTHVKQYAERLRERKHEFSNLLHLISGYIQIGEYDKAITLISQDHLPDERTIEHFKEMIQDPIVASIFIGKYYYAFEKGIELELDDNSNIQEIIDPLISKHFVMILGNVINNAIDAALDSKAKKVKLFATDIGNDIVFEIEDSGKGIDESMIVKIFEKGFTTKSELHCGYGLFFVKNTLELINGFITIVPSNYGTITSIYIPKKVEI
jgi:two-component system, CitB family, sensor kinase